MTFKYTYYIPTKIDVNILSLQQTKIFLWLFI